MRREIITILIMTALVVTAVAVLGPRMTSLSSGTPERAESIPLSPKPEIKGQAQDRPEHQPQPVRSKDGVIRVTPIDEVTGERIPGVYAAVTAIFDDSSLLESTRGASADQALELIVQSGQIRLSLSVFSHLEWRSDPLQLESGQVLDLGRVSLTPLVPITLKNPDAKDWSISSVDVVRTWPLPSALEAASIGQSVSVHAGQIALRLPPGKYRGRIPSVRGSPYSYADEGRLPVSFDYSRTFRFEVKVGDEDVVVSFDEDMPEQSVVCSVRNMDGEVPRPVWVWAISKDALFGDEVVAAALSDEAGAALLRGLRPGRVAIVAGREEYARETDSGSMRSLKLVPDAETAPQTLAVREYAWDGTTTDQSVGRLEVVVTDRGRPVEGARLYRQSRHGNERQRGGWVGPHSDAEGRIVLEAARTGDYWFDVSLATCREFFFKVKPGGTMKGQIEVHPEGTTSVSGTLIKGENASVWANLELERTGHQHIPQLIPLRLSNDGSFQLRDVPPGSHRVAVWFGEENTRAYFPLKVAGEDEHRWTGSLKSYPVTVSVPAGKEHLIKPEYSLHLVERGGVEHELKSIVWDNSQAKISEVWPGIYRLEFRSHESSWISDEFTVSDAAVRVTEWKEAASPSWPSPDRRLVQLLTSVESERLPPWLNKLEAWVHAGNGGQESYWAKIHPGERQEHHTWTELSADSLEIESDWFETIRVPLDSESEVSAKPDEIQIALKPKYKSLLIYLESGVSLDAKAAQLWETKFRTDDGAWRYVTGPSRESDSQGRSSMLISRDGRPALFVPDVARDAETLEIVVPGFKPVTLRVAATQTGYHELECVLEPE
ncbi:MAG: hypothetical protein KDB68_10420 [Planctomycetes bacterium]|nr:hypothetical protein [Planctomycetota bacterium]